MELCICMDATIITMNITILNFIPAIVCVLPNMNLRSPRFSLSKHSWGSLSHAHKHITNRLLPVRLLVAFGLEDYIRNLKLKDSRISSIKKQPVEGNFRGFSPNRGFSMEASFSGGDFTVFGGGVLKRPSFQEDRDLPPSLLWIRPNSIWFRSWGVLILVRFGFGVDGFRRWRRCQWLPLAIRISDLGLIFRWGFGFDFRRRSWWIVVVPMVFVWFSERKVVDRMRFWVWFSERKFGFDFQMWV